MYKALALVGCIASLFAFQGCSKPKSADAAPVAAAPAPPAASSPAPSTPAASSPAPQSSGPSATTPAAAGPSKPVASGPSKPVASGPAPTGGGGSAASDGDPDQPMPAFGLGNTGKPTAAGAGVPTNAGGLLGGTGTGGKPTASGPGMSLPTGGGAPATGPGAGGLLGGASFGSAGTASAPPVIEKLTLKDRAIAAFQTGNTRRAYALMAAHALQATDEEASEILKNYRWAQSNKRPQLGINMAVGVTISKNQNATEIAPIGKNQGNGAANAGGGMMGRGSSAGGARPNGPIEVKSFADATGDFGNQLVEAFREKHDEGVWTEVFREYSLGTPSAPSGSLGFGGLAGGTGFGGAAPPTAAGGPPAGYTGGGGPPAGYTGGGGPPAGYTGGGGPPAGYTGGGGPPAGYTGGSGPPAGYTGGGGPPAGYTGGGGGPPAGYTGGGGPPAGYNGGSGGMKPQSSGGGGSPVQFRRRQAGLDDGAPGPATTGLPGAGMGRPGFGNAPSAPAAFGRDVQLPPGHQALAPCLTYIGSGDANKLIKKALEEGFDGIMIFEIELTLNKVVGKVINETRIRVLLPKENIKETKAVFSSKRLNNIQAAKSRAEGKSDGVDDVVELVVKKTHESFGLLQIPGALTPEVIASRRVPALAADKSGSVLGRLSEVNFYFSQGLLDENQKADAFEKIAGADGQKLAIGSPDEKLAVVEKLLDREFK